ncbi:MAG TPA: N-acetylmuramoyl-L-alanine amidase [Solirubrobacteraceae bacterium]|nr:N-acetylmuramoyl-L-alanine amidase [Solirubrobacteraceae bacterium]
MADRGLTRRSLLGAAGGSLAALARAPRALGAAVDGAAGRSSRARGEPPLPAGQVGERALGLLGPGLVTLALSGSADLLALGWAEPPGAGPQLRFRTPEGAWSPWVAAAHAAHDGDHDAAAPPPGVVGEPVWSGGTRLVQVRSAHALAGARLYTVDVSGGAGAARLAAATQARVGAAATPPLAGPQLAAGPGQPPIVAREFWARGQCPPSRAPAYGAVELGFVHHTETPNGYSHGEVPAMLRAIYVFHRRVRRWHDIGYNFALDRFGRIFEARAGGIDEAVIGAQAGGYNAYSTGVALLGTFTGRPLSSAALTSLQRLLAWKLSLHGVPALGRVTVTVDPEGAVYSRYPGGSEVSLPRIAGHRDADSTSCPGNALYGELPAVRARAHALAGTPVQATIATLDGGLFGTLTLLDGTPLEGQPLTLQSRAVSRRGELVAENPVAQVQTDAEGQWTLPEGPPPAQPQWLRALFAGAGPYGAAVSEAVAARPPAPPVPVAPAPAG